MCLIKQTLANSLCPLSLHISCPNSKIHCRRPCKGRTKKERHPNVFSVEVAPISLNVHSL